ncbi:MAG: histidine phosphatase family protein [Pseudomonadota bacterium]
MSPIPLKPFYMIRHGQTQANAARIMAGSTDSPLTEKGIEEAKQARIIIESLAIKPVAIFHSDLSRARDTAIIINEGLGVPMHEDPDLAEIHAGELEGVSYDECHELFNGWPTVKGGETPNEFFERVKRGKSRAIEQYREPVLIVCHGGVMRAFGALHNIEPPSAFKNAHPYQFIPNQQKMQFPWDVYDYSIDPETQKITRIKNEVYDSGSLLTMEP